MRNHTDITSVIKKQREEKILEDCDKKADKIISRMQDILRTTHKKIDDYKYNQVVGKLKKYI